MLRRHWKLYSRKKNENFRVILCSESGYYQGKFHKVPIQEFRLQKLNDKYEIPEQQKTFVEIAISTNRQTADRSQLFKEIVHQEVIYSTVVQHTTRNIEPQLKPFG